MSLWGHSQSHGLTPRVFSVSNSFFVSAESENRKNLPQVRTDATRGVVFVLGCAFYVTWGLGRGLVWSVLVKNTGRLGSDSWGEGDPIAPVHLTSLVLLFLKILLTNS